MLRPLDGIISVIRQVLSVEIISKLNMRDVLTLIR